MPLLIKSVNLKTFYTSYLEVPISEGTIFSVDLTKLQQKANCEKTINK